MLLPRLIIPVLILATLAAAAPAEEADNVWVFFGTYTGKSSKGIYRSEFNTKTGKLSVPELAAEVASPSFLAIHPNHKFLYAVGELDRFAGKAGGAVYAFSLDASSGQLKQLNAQSSGGPGPCYLVVDHSGKNVLVANYGGGSVACLPIKADGTLSPASSFIQHAGKSSNPQRQEGPHAHSINVDANNHFAIVADLGLDKLLVYRFDADKGTLTPNDPPFLATAPAPARGTSPSTRTASSPTSSTNWPQPSTPCTTTPRRGDWNSSSRSPRCPPTIRARPRRPRFRSTRRENSCTAPTAATTVSPPTRWTRKTVP